MRPRIRTILHVEMYFDFMASSYARNGSSANVVLIGVWCDSPAERRGNDNRHNTFRPNEKQRANQSKSKLKHPNVVANKRTKIVPGNGVDGNRAT